MNVLHDLRIGARRLRRDWPFTAVAVFVLALGLGATNTMFTITYSLFFRPLPFTDPDRVVVVTVEDRGDPANPFQLASLNEIDGWRRANTVAAIGAFDYEAMSIGEAETPPEQVSGLYLTANTFGLLGVQPMLGRDFRPEEDRAGSGAVVMLSETLWRTRFQQDPSIVGRTIRVNGAPATVVGVMAAGFSFPNNIDAWQPFGAMPAARRTATSERGFTAIARLKPGVTTEQALADLTAVRRTVPQNASSRDTIQPRIRDFRRLHVGEAATPVFSVLMASVAFVLLIACANVANLLLTRAAKRAREVSIRLAVGAGRGRIVRELLAESAVLAMLAAAGGWLLSIGALAALRPVLANANPPYWFTLALDPSIFATFAAISAATVFFFGLAPAMYVARARAMDVLSDGARGSTEGIRRRRWTSALVASQLALTVILLTCASLSIRDLVVDIRDDGGVDLRNLQVTRMELPLARYPERGQRVSFYSGLDERLADWPMGVATIASAWPRSNVPNRLLRTTGQADPVSVRTLVAGPRYLTALGRRPVNGREFVASDGARVALMNERLASMIAAGGDAIGRQVRLAASGAAPATDWLTVVGIAPNIRQGSTSVGGVDPVLYIPVAAAPIPAMAIIVRSTVASGTVAATLRDRMRTLDAEVPIFPTQPIEAMLEANRGEGRLLSDLLGGFAAIAFVLAAVGLYAMTAFSVVQRTREIGVRIAIGARTADILRLILRRASAQLIVGVVLGVGGATVLAPVLARAALRHVQSYDATAIAVVVVALVAIASLGCVIPARRGALLDPVEALRIE